MRIRRIASLVLVVAAVLGAVSMTRLTVDNRLEKWVDSDPEATSRYREFRDLFGSDEFVVIAIWGRPLFDAEALDRLLEAAERIERIPGVERVDGPPVVYRDVFGAEDPGALREEITSTPFYEGLFVSRDESTVGLLVQVAPEDAADARRRISAALLEAVEPLVDSGFEVRLVGSTVLGAALDEVSQREAMRTLPLAFVLSMVFLVFLIRSLRGMVVAVLCAGGTVVITLGLMAIVGRPLTMVSSALPPLLFVLALANCIHVLQAYQHARADLPTDQAIEAALGEVSRSCILASVTTSAGFLSLVAADMAPVREVGVFAAAGILISLPLNLVLGPEVVRLLGVPARAARTRVGLGWSARLVFRHPVVALGVIAAATVAAALAVPLVDVKSNPLGFLPQGHSVTRAYVEVGKRLTGFYSMEVVVRPDGRWTRPEVWPWLQNLRSTIEEAPAVARVLTPLDVLRKLRQWDAGFDPSAYALPSSEEEAAELLEGLDERGRALLDSLVAQEGRAIRLSAVVDEMDEARFLELAERTRNAVAELPETWQGFVTGMVLRLVSAQKNLVSSQLRSLGLAALVVFLTIGLGLRSLRLLGLSVLPNLLPVLGVFALMGIASVPLDAATVMVASIALGIAVDNTVHLLAGYRRRRQLGESPIPAVHETLHRVGSPVVITSLTASIGFFSLMVSAFVPIRDFGLLAGSAMLVALVADLVLIPSMLVVGGRR